jgi:cytochrome b pre-mRNA-processing protein 3
VPARLNPLDRLRQWRSGASNSEKLYGAIVAQARLPIFYRSLGVPDTLEGRFTLLSLHLFAVLHRFKTEGSEGDELVQGLVDRFSRDMDTVLRELGVSDIRIPKKMRGLAASSMSLLQAYENAFVRGQSALAEAIEATLPDGTANPELSSRALASYLWASMTALEHQTFGSLKEGAIEFPEVSQPK